MDETTIPQKPEGTSCPVGEAEADVCPDLNTDHRKKYDWKSRYPRAANIQILIETAWAAFVLFIPLVLIVLDLDGNLTTPLSSTHNSQNLIHTFFIYSTSGMLGGATYGVKYLYRVVGRGYWHQDRIVWRIMSPFVSMVLGLVVGALIESTMINSIGEASLGRCIAIGFMAGYFADQAVGKMCDVAEAIFGKATSQS